MPLRTPARRRPRHLAVGTQSSPVRYLLLAALIGMVAIVAGGAVLVRHNLSGNRSTDSLSASAVSNPSSAATQSASGAGLPHAVIDTEVSFAPMQVMAVTQHVTLDRPVTSLRLTLPKWTRTVSGGEFHPLVKDFHVILGNQPPLRVHRTRKPGESFRVALPSPARRFDVVYAALGAVRRSEPSSAHRALALVTLVTMAPDDAVTNTIHFTGANVTNLGCIAPSGTAAPCGFGTADGWSVTQGPGEQRTAIIAQLDLHP